MPPIIYNFLEIFAHVIGANFGTNPLLFFEKDNGNESKPDMTMSIVMEMEINEWKCFIFKV